MNSGVHLRDFVYFDDGLKNDERKLNVRTLKGSMIKFLASITDLSRCQSSFEYIPRVSALRTPLHAPEYRGKCETLQVFIVLSFLLAPASSDLRIFPDSVSMEDSLELSKKIEPRNATRENIA